MDKNQIKLYVEQNIKAQELSHPRLALELEHFIEALSSQKETLGRVLTPEQIQTAWQNWKLERFHYVEHVKIFTSKNIQQLEAMTAQRVAEIEPELKNNPRLAQEVQLFAPAYARRLQHLAKQPLIEHIDTAWEAWKRGYKY